MAIITNQVNKTSKTVFLSYAHADKTIARLLFTNLQNSGLSVYLDEFELHPFENVRIELESRLNNSDWYLLLWSKHANREWVIWELTQALQRTVYTKMRILVVRTDHSDLPESIRHNLAIDLDPTYRLGLARVLAHLTDEPKRFISVPCEDEFFRPNIAEIKWHLEQPIQDSSEVIYSVVLEDNGVINKLDEILIQPANLVGLTPMPYPVDLRHNISGEIDYLFSIAESVATTIINQRLYLSTNISSANTFAIEICRRFISWVYVRGFIRLFSRITLNELDLLEEAFQKKVNSLFSKADTLTKSAFSFGLNNQDIIEFILGSEAPLSRDRFEKVDLIINKSFHSNAGTEYISLYLPQHPASGISNWINRLYHSTWPPENYLLDEYTWSLVFIPQIARYIFLMRENSKEHLKSDEFNFFVDINNYTKIGPH